MGSVCSGGTGRSTKNMPLEEKSTGFSTRLKSMNSFSNLKEMFQYKEKSKDDTDGKPESSWATKRTSFLERAGTVGLGRAVEVLDTLGSSMSSLNPGSGFVSGMASRGNKLFILAFEVANTIAKGANLLQSLSEENIRFLRNEILYSEGVRQLVSTDMDELLIIAAADKREELDVFTCEVIRFGNHCKDPQWHNLDRYFSKSNPKHINSVPERGEAESRMHELVTLAKNTSEVYHELQALDRFEQDYKRKLEEAKALNLNRKGEGLMMLQSELKQQRKFVAGLKKKSLWSRSFEEIMEKLVDIVNYMNLAIMEAFGNDGSSIVNKKPGGSPERLGATGLALHYANVIHQIDNTASRPSYLPPNIRDTLYQRLPAGVKTALRSRLQSLESEEELSFSQIKDEMEKILKWLRPLATNTTKAHQGFGWVGEWANTGIEFGKGTATDNNLIRLQTLYHADKQKMDTYILKLVILLCRLITSLKKRDNGSKPQRLLSPTRKGLEIHSQMQRSLSLGHHHHAPNRILLSLEDRILLERVSKRRTTCGTSKSQEFGSKKKRKSKVWALSRSTGHSPSRNTRERLEREKANKLDVMDGLDLAI